MTVANTLISLALRTTGISGVGQTPSAEDMADSFAILNDMIGQWQAQRTVMVIPGTLPAFANRTTDVAFWTPFENLLLTTLSVRLRAAFGMAADEALTTLATNALQIFQANNRQQVPSPHPGIPTTCQQMIGLALRMAGRITDAQGVSDSSADVNDALAMMTMLVGQWQRKRWLTWSLTETIVISTGATSYTVSPTGNFPIPRPDRIESAFVRYLPSISVSGTFQNNGGVITIVAGSSSLPTSPPVGPGLYWNNGGVLMVTAGAPTTVGTTYVDIPLGIIESREDFNTIALKTFQAWPAGVFYESAFPTGLLHFWPVPSPSVYELHVFTKAALPVYATVNDALNLPPEYSEAMLYSLAVRLEMAAGGDPKPSHVAAMRAALNTVRMANVQEPSLQMPRDLPGRPRRNGSNMAAFISGRW